MHKTHETIADITREALERAGVSVTVSLRESAMPHFVIESTQDLSDFIGTRGDVLHALEHLVRLMAFRALPDAPHDVTLDINGYRETEMSRLLAIAKEKAEQVLATGKAESLPTMNAYERKVVHTQLATYTSLKTESIGAEPNRRVVIKPA